ncbi:MAG: Stk1 family PASTA domain-containing Ser/Thr kinase [Eubacteriales bacterium]|nr:Stk1 family PASTA domain-containing Ser/Thr kinase [Eubacteriales bacterium]
MLKEGMFIQGRYEVVGMIGTGGMADVYKARDHKLNRFVAVKVLKAEFRSDKAFVTKFRAEAQAAAGLAHPNIVNIYDVGEDHGMHFIVMELVEGITLKEYVMKKGKLTVREATSIAIQVSQGLETAHNAGIIHRDVKPQNIIISTDGKVKVTDFGIAKAVTSNTTTTSAMGSVHYSSPEQARGGYSDARSDIYSLGITLYEMLTGRLPFDGDSTVAIAIKHLQEEIRSPEYYVPDLPHSTIQIINKCTQKSPDRRYQNMMELIRDLKESLVNPDGDFVQIVNPVGGKTVVISREELSAIKDGYNAAEHNGQQNAGESSYREKQDHYDPYTYGMDSRAYGKRGYDYQEEHYDNRRPYVPDDDEDDDDILNPRLERIMTVATVIIAILIAAIFFGLAASALGVFKFGLPSIFGTSSSTEATVVTTEAETSSLTIQVEDQDSGVGVQNSLIQTPETQAAVTTEAPTQETTATEKKVEIESASEEETKAATEPATEAPTEVSTTGTVPEVIGYSYDSAVNILMEAGFYVLRQDESSDAYAADVVMEQSMTGNAELGSTVILIVSTGAQTEAPVAEEQPAAADGVWACNVQLDDPGNYNGQQAILVLEQAGTSTTLAAGVLSFPYTLNTQGVAGQTSGVVSLSVLDETTGQYNTIVTYDVPFSQVG